MIYFPSLQEALCPSVPMSGFALGSASGLAPWQEQVKTSDEIGHVDAWGLTLKAVASGALGRSGSQPERGGNEHSDRPLSAGQCSLAGGHLGTALMELLTWYHHWSNRTDLLRGLWGLRETVCTSKSKTVPGMQFLLKVVTCLWLLIPHACHSVLTRQDCIIYHIVPLVKINKGFFPFSKNGNIVPYIFK